MPWKTFSLLEARQRFVRTALGGFKSVAQLCRETRISRKTGFKWLRRFRTAGGPGLHDLSRRPKHSPHRTASRWLAAIGSVRRKHSSWGGKKIYARLRQQHPRARLPKPRTITDWLRRFGGKRSRRNKARPGPRRPRPKVTIPRAPNDVWTVDFKGWFRTRDGQRVNPLTVRDLFSRFIWASACCRWNTRQSSSVFRRCLFVMGNPRSSGWITGRPLPAAARWTCRGFRLGGCVWASRSSSRGGPARKTTARTNRCIASTKPRPPHRPPPHRWPSSVAPPTGRVITTTTGRRRRWDSKCRLCGITKVVVVIADRCPRYAMRVAGAPGVSVRGASSIGGAVREASVALSAARTSDSSLWQKACRKFILSAISSAF